MPRKCERCNGTGREFDVDCPIYRGNGMVETAFEQEQRIRQLLAQSVARQIQFLEQIGDFYAGFNFSNDALAMLYGQQIEVTKDIKRCLDMIGHFKGAPIVKPDAIRVPPPEKPQ